MISCVFQKLQKLAGLISWRSCTGHAHVFAYLGYWDGRDAPGIFWEFLGIYLEGLLYKGQIWPKLEIFISLHFCTELGYIFPECCEDWFKVFMRIFLEFIEQQKTRIQR